MACDNPDCYCKGCSCDPCMCTEDKPCGCDPDVKGVPPVVEWKQEEEWKQKEWQQLDVLEGVI